MQAVLITKCVDFTWWPGEPAAINTCVVDDQTFAQLLAKIVDTRSSGKTLLSTEVSAGDLQAASGLRWAGSEG